MPKAVLWDMDGTIIDSEPYWLISERRLVEEFGGEWTDLDGLSLIGSSLPKAAAHLQSRGVTMDTDSIVNRMVAEVNQMVTEEIPWRPGARELLKSIADAAIPQVIVTMSYRTSAEFIANEIGLFAGLITGDEVTHGKPHPEPFLLGAELVGVNAKDCVAFEDSGPGSQSAIAAGAVTIVAPLNVPLPPDPNYTLWQTLVGRTIHDVVKVFNEVRS